jgi:DNA-binding transcriptional MocR family regulator
MAWIPRLAARSSRLAASELRELLKLLVDPTVISFAGGVPDPDLFPQAELRAAYDRALASPVSARIGLQYTVSEGYLPLREWIAGYMRSENIKCDPTNILILSGSQQGLDFAAKLFLDPQDSVIVQEPTFLGALQAFRSFEGTFDVLDTVQPAEEYRSGTRTPKLLYASADFRNPTGKSETLLGRRRILSVAHRLDVALLEDNAYRHLRYDGTALGSLTALDLDGRHIDEGRSLYLGTFSKSVAPGLRVAWLAAPAHLIEKFVYTKRVMFRSAH